MSDLTQYHLQRLQTLKADRGNWNVQWEEAAERVVPSHRTSFASFGQTTVFGIGGQKRTELQFDSTAALAAMRFASVMESLTTPQNSIWQRLKVIDKTLARNRQVRIFFDDLTDLLFNYRYRPIGNFVANMQMAFFGLGVYGNGILFVDRPDKSKGLRYRNVHLGQAYFVENHAGIVDTLYRLFPLANRQIVEQFGEGAPQHIRDLAANPQQMEAKKEVLHVVTPRAEFMPGMLGVSGMEYDSIHILVETQDLMKRGGFTTFPYKVMRYTQAPGEVYGRGPAQMVLPSIKVLNEEKKVIIKQGHRIVDPVLLAHDDGKLGNFSLKPGALNKGGISAEGKRLIDVLPTGNLAVGDKIMEMERETIKDAFLVTLFQILVDSPQMTATEVLERAREKGMLLAPTAGRLQADFLGPLVERELDLLAAQGLLPPMPAILQQAAAEYKVEPDSPMSRMARAEKAAGFMRALSVAGDYAKATGDMAPLDHFSFDRAMPEILDIHGAPAEWTSTPDEIAAKRQGRSQAAQQQQLVDTAPALASVAKANPAMKG